MSGRLEGLVAVVNGAGRGIGRSVALESARQGARVVVNDLGINADGTRDAARAQRVADLIISEGGEALADGGDISQSAEADALISKAIDAFGKLDILVNAAGNNILGTVVDTEPEDFDAIMRVHVGGYYNTTRRAAQHWVERGEYGRLINFVSMAAIVSHPSLFAYSTAKTAIVGMTRSCANALVSYGVTANCIRPNAATGMTDAMTPQSVPASAAADGSPTAAIAGSLTDPMHIAPLVVYLSSPEAANVSGRFLEARGGHYALWTEPQPELVFEGDFLADPDGVYGGIQHMLGDLSLRDLKMPMPPFAELGDWRAIYGSRLPTWDFAGFAGV